jgi:predicted acetyltransferase
MNITIEEIRVDEKEILKNLLEKYNYEFSQYEETDVNKLGLYGYDWLDCYWTEEKRFPYFIKVNNIIAGFILVNDYPETNIKTDYTLSEFFVMYKYRRLGVGKYVVNNILKKYHGKWQLKFHPHNVISEKFWINTVNEYTKGKYKIIDNDEKTKYRDGTIGKVLIFET